MAAVVALTPVPSSCHVFPPHRNHFITFHQHSHRTPAASHRNPFEAFAPHHHSGPNSRSATASWRHSEPIVRSPNPVRTPSPENHRSGPSHLRAPSTSSESSSTSWRSQIHIPTRESEASDPRIGDSSPFVYSIVELLRLSASPLVGISKESQIALDDLVAHHVWRRGPQSGTLRAGGRRKSRDVSRPRSLHTSTDESGHSD